MINHFRHLALIGCALIAVPALAVAGPSKADLEKALSACPAGQSPGQDGLCAPSKAGQMGYDFIPGNDDAAAGGARRGLVDLQMTFANASWMLTDADRETADTLTGVLMEPANASKLVEIGGHTNSIGGDEYNRGLSQKRAEAVKVYLVRSGVPADRLKTVGYGSAQPLQGSDPAAPENRRVMLTMLGTKQP